MEKAEVSEIFVSYQGEGPYAGSRQLFVRFFECNLECAYCDTKFHAYGSFSAEELLSRVNEFGDDYNELVLTGGEPLLYSGFLKIFLGLVKESSGKRIYLETNGTLPGKFREIRDHVDIVSMDLKLPSAVGSGKAFWQEHREFLKVSKGKELIVKAVVTGDAEIEEMEKAAEMIGLTDKAASVILQPVTVEAASVKEAGDEVLDNFVEIIKAKTGRRASVVGQIHKALGIR